jgi:hypothetical protein
MAKKQTGPKAAVKKTAAKTSKAVKKETPAAVKKKPVAKKRAVQSKATAKVLEIAKQQKAGEWKRDTGKQPHGVIDAKAGTGKTTTLIGGLQVMRGWNPGFKPTEQQEAIWEFMARKPLPVSVKMVAFNYSIAKTLQERCPPGVEASTMHSMGYAAVRKAFSIGGKYAVQDKKTQYQLEAILGKDLEECWKDHADIMRAVPQLVSKCKMQLVGYQLNGSAVNWGTGSFDVETIDEKTLADLCAKFEIEVAGFQDEVFDYTKVILEKCYRLDEQDRKIVNFDDMIWLPVVRNLSLYKHDLLLVDEAQDLNPVQQQLALRAGERIILCGDPRQAIYGFAGADTDSIPNMQKMLESTSRGCEVFPLNKTFRCGKKIVAEANDIVPDYYAFEGNHDGEIQPEFSAEQLLETCETGDMVVCRTNAPLVGPAFRFIANGKKAQIVGGKIGEQLLSFVKKFNAEDAGELMAEVGDWYDQECQKMAKS